MRTRKLEKRLRCEITAASPWPTVTVVQISCLTVYNLCT